MKTFLQTIVLTVLFAQVPCSIARGFNCCSSTGELDVLLNKSISKWDESRQSITSGIDRYQKSVSNVQSKESCESGLKDIKFVKDGATTLIKQVSRVTDGLVQSLRQAILIAQYIERLTNEKKSEKACNALRDSIELIKIAAKQIQKCQDQYNDAVKCLVADSTEEIKKICPKNIGNEIFFNYARLSLKISAAGNAFKKCKANALDTLNAKLNSLLNTVTSC